jgi:hypothetical protein
MDNQIRYTVTANDLLTGKLQNMNQSAGMLNSTMGNLGTVIAGAFSVYAISSFVKSVVSAGTTVENATTGLTTLLGDAGEATRVIQNTMDDASKTPFEKRSFKFSQRNFGDRGRERRINPNGCKYATN